MQLIPSCGRVFRYIITQFCSPQPREGRTPNVEVIDVLVRDFLETLCLDARETTTEILNARQSVAHARTYFSIQAASSCFSLIFMILQ